MPLDIAGYSLSNSSGLKLGTSSSFFDSSGRIRSSILPAMNGAQTNFSPGHRQYPWQVDSVSINTNGVWSSSSVFTCPVAGVYYTSWATICQGGASATPTSTNTGYNALIKNGGTVYHTHWNTNDYWDTQNLECLVKCAAGDTLAWACNIAPGPDTGSGVGALGSNHNTATIWLVG